MTLVIPNYQSITSGFYGQSIADSTDYAALAAAADDTGVVAGCTVTQDTGADMKVAVAAGTVKFQGTQYTVAATGGSPLTVGAASAGGDRRDIVVYTVGTGLQVIAGAASGVGNYPVKPAIPASSVLLGEVYVGEATTAITTATNIVDKTTPVPGTTTFYVDLAATDKNITASGDTVVFTSPSLGIGTWDLSVVLSIDAGTASSIKMNCYVVPTASGGATVTNPSATGAPGVVISSPSSAALPSDRTNASFVVKGLVVTAAGTLDVRITAGATVAAVVTSQQAGIGAGSITLQVSSFSGVRLP